MQRKSKATVVAAIGTALALVGQSSASAHVGYNWHLSSSVQTASQITSTSAVTPLVGDFNGDDRSDVLFYAPGASADYLWLSKPFDAEGNPADRFSVTTLSVSGTYAPLVGDFDGNGATDIFWYAPGINSDTIWYFDDGAVSSSVSRRINGQYAPVVANLDSSDTDDGNEKDDILWYSVTRPSESSLWSGKTDRTFSSRAYSSTPPPKDAKVLPGNWTVDSELTDGTYHADLFFYVPGKGADAIWTGDGTGEFTSTAKSIGGTYIPVVGNFDLVDEAPAQGTALPAGLTDILWYAPGTGGDSVWMNTGTSFTSTPLTIDSASFKPFVIPNILGGDTIMWNNPAGTDARWQPRGITAFEYSSSGWPAADMGTRTPLVGMFDDDQTSLAAFGPYGADVLWVQAGNTTAQKEVLWVGDDGGKVVL